MTLLPTPKGFERYDYQTEGVKLLKERLASESGAFLCDEPGVGKTAQAICLANELIACKVLVVCPASPKINWQREFGMWGIWGLKMDIIKPKEELTDHCIINYDILTRFDFSKIQYDFVIFDESHYLKNVDSKRTQAAFTIQANKKILMSGTPMPNRPKELWSQLLLLEFVEANQYNSFLKKFCNLHKRKIPIRTKGGGIRYRFINDDTGATNLDQLGAFLKKKGMVRRFKSDVIKELPPKTYQIIEVAQKRQWKSNLLKSAIPVDKASKDQITYFRDLASATRGKGTGCDSMYETIAETRRMEGIDKIPFAMDFILDKLDSLDKLIVFVHHTEVFEGLRDALKKKGIKTVGIYGKTPSGKRRQDAVDAFQGDKTVQVFLGQIKAAGTAITLTAASHVLFVEMDWVPGNMEQAADRAHRNGQKNNVTVWYLVFTNTVDALVAKKLIEKQKVIDKTIDPNPLDINELLLSGEFS